MRGCSPESSAAAAGAFESGVLRAAASWDSSSRGALPCKMLSSTWVQRGPCGEGHVTGAVSFCLGHSVQRAYWEAAGERTPCERLNIQVASGQVASKTRSRTTSSCTQSRKPAPYLQSQPGRGPLKVSLVGRHCCLQYPSRRCPSDLILAPNDQNLIDDRQLPFFFPASDLGPAKENQTSTPSKHTGYPTSSQFPRPTASIRAH